jgi:hypothetical protein
LEYHSAVGANFNVEITIGNILFASEAEGAMQVFLAELAMS